MQALTDSLQEMLRYLGHIHSVWNRIVRSHSNDIVDAFTVESLQMLAPQSSLDFRKIKSLMHEKGLFPSVQNKYQRDKILHNLRRVQCLIPSLYTFFENLKYLEPCCVAIKTLLPAKQKKTIFQAFHHCYREPDRPFIETAAGRAYYDHEDGVKSERIAYLQIWLCAMRNFPDLTVHTPRKDIDGMKPLPKGPNPLALHHWGRLAVALGFSTRRAVGLSVEDAERTLINNFLEQAALEPSDTKIAMMTRLLRTMSTPTATEEVHDDVGREEGGGTPLSSDYDSASDLDDLTTDQTTKHNSVRSSARHLPVERRCGRPFEEHHYIDRHRLYLDILWEATEASALITPFTVKIDILQGFLGILDVEVSRFCPNTTYAL